MGTFLFDKIVFGPVHSRRLGNSLGINLLPVDVKYCNFNCIYCECGWTDNNNYIQLPDKKEIALHLEERLRSIKDNQEKIDVITFAGNGEPTLHPQFIEILEITQELAGMINPKPKIAVLSNATMLHKKGIIKALKKIDFPILKIDSAIPDTFNKINMPQGNLSIESIIKNIGNFNGEFFLQIMFFRGNETDNTTETEIQELLNVAGKLNPRQIMIYSIDRDTPAKGLQGIPEDELKQLATRFSEKGFIVQVSA